MTEAYRKLKRLLDELVRFDRADLDFGIYRVMNRKRKEVSSFLHNNLLPQICKEPEPTSSSVATSPK